MSSRRWSPSSAPLSLKMRTGALFLGLVDEPGLTVPGSSGLLVRRLRLYCPKDCWPTSKYFPPIT